MKIRKTILLLLHLLLLQYSYGQLLVEYRGCVDCNAQNHTDPFTLFAYDLATTAYQSSDVSSDFGARDAGAGHYDWHGGVDYSSEAGNDVGDGIVAIEGGVINNLRIGNRGFKYITVNSINNDFGYAHIFTSREGTQKSGNFYITMIEDSDPVAYALTTEDCRALSTMSGLEVVDPITGNIITTTNNLLAGQTVGPIGTSSGSSENSSLPSHLHLYTFDNNNFSLSDENTKNPLELVQHDLPFYNLTFWQPS